MIGKLFQPKYIYIYNHGNTGKKIFIQGKKDYVV